MALPQLPKAPATTVVAVVGVVCSSFFTYLSSRAEAEAAKVQSAAGYVALQTSVKELQTATYDRALEVAKLEGRVDTLEAAANARRRHIDAEPKPVFEVDAGHVEPAPVKLSAPPSLGVAVQQYKDRL